MKRRAHLGQRCEAAGVGAHECSDLLQDVMDKLLIDAERKYPDLSQRERFIDGAIHYTKIEMATEEAKRRQQQRQQQQAK